MPRPGPVVPTRPGTRPHRWYLLAGERDNRESAHLNLEIPILPGREIMQIYTCYRPGQAGRFGISHPVTAA